MRWRCGRCVPGCSNCGVREQVQVMEAPLIALCLTPRPPSASFALALYVVAQAGCTQDTESKNAPRYVQAAIQTDASLCLQVEEASQTEDSTEWTLRQRPNTPADAHRLSTPLQHAPGAPAMVHMEASDLFELQPSNLFDARASGSTTSADECRKAQAPARVGAAAAAALGEGAIAIVLSLDLNLADVKDTAGFMEEVHADVVWAAGLDPSKVVVSHIFFPACVRLRVRVPTCQLACVETCKNVVCALAVWRWKAGM